MATYYVRPASWNGTAGSGLTINDAFKGLATVPETVFAPGNTLALYCNGDSFVQEQLIVLNKKGRPYNPFRITGAMSATQVIFDGTGLGFVENTKQSGVWIENCAWFVLDSFKITKQPQGGLVIHLCEQGLVSSITCDDNGDLNTLEWAGHGFYVGSKSYSKNSGLFIVNCFSTYNRASGFSIKGRGIYLIQCEASYNCQGEAGFGFGVGSDKLELTPASWSDNGNGTWSIDLDDVTGAKGLSVLFIFAYWSADTSKNCLLVPVVDLATCQATPGSCYYDIETGVITGNFGDPANQYGMIYLPLNASNNNTLIECVSHHNVATSLSEGAGFAFDDGSFENKLIRSLAYSNGGPGFYVNGGVRNKLINSIAYGNSTEAAHTQFICGAYLSGARELQVIGCMFVGNAGKAIKLCGKYGSPVILNNVCQGGDYSLYAENVDALVAGTVINNNCLYGATTAIYNPLAIPSYYGVSNILLDPLLTDPAMHDFTPSSSSPCKNAGADLSAYVDALFRITSGFLFKNTAVGQNVRSIGSVGAGYDIGAYKIDASGHSLDLTAESLYGLSVVSGSSNYVRPIYNVETQSIQIVTSGNPLISRVYDLGAAGNLSFTASALSKYRGSANSFLSGDVSPTWTNSIDGNCSLIGCRYVQFQFGN